MAENKNGETPAGKFARGVIVEFDFVCADGMRTLFEVAKKKLESIGCTFDEMVEAKHLAGGNTQGGIAELFSATKNKHDPAKAARELLAQAAQGYTANLASGVTPDLKAFIKALTAKNVKVVLATRGDAAKLQELLAEYDATQVVAYQEISTTYGNCKWDAWKRALSTNELMDVFTVAVTASGKGVKSALIAGMSAIAVPDDHVAYQDFGGADAVLPKIGAKAADEVLRLLRIA